MRHALSYAYMHYFALAVWPFIDACMQCMQHFALAARLADMQWQ